MHIATLARSALSPIGRLGRRDYLATLGVAFVVSTTLDRLKVFLFFNAGKLDHVGALANSQAFALLGLANFALFLWVAFCAVAKRLHDFGQTAAWALTPIGVVLAFFLIAGDDLTAMTFLALITTFGLFPACALAAVILAAVPGQDGANRFGPPSDQVGQRRASDRPVHATQTPWMEAFQPVGRFDRRAYIGTFAVFYGAVAGLVLVALMLMLVVRPTWTAEALISSPAFQALGMIAFAAVSWIAFCISAKRLHDMDQSALWAFAPFAIYAGACCIVALLEASDVTTVLRESYFLLFGFHTLFGLYLMFGRGDYGPNRYGPPSA